MKLRFTPRGYIRFDRYCRLYPRSQSGRFFSGTRRHPFVSAKRRAVPRDRRRQTVEGVRKIVTRRYRYLVFYTVDHANEEMVILTIRHAARRQEYADV